MPLNTKFLTQIYTHMTTTRVNENSPEYQILNSGIRSVTNLGLIQMFTDGDVIQAQAIIDLCRNNFAVLSKMSIAELANVTTQKRAAKILLAFEMSNRSRIDSIANDKISSSQSAVDFIAPMIENCIHEEFWVMFLNRANRIITMERISEGGFSGTIADPKKIFSMALANKACSMIIAHNHPSGNTRPSDADIALTKRIKSGGQLLEINVLDSIIIGENSKYFSFADEGLM